MVIKEESVVLNALFITFSEFKMLDIFSRVNIMSVQNLHRILTTNYC